jgi:hypothetical protein
MFPSLTGWHTPRSSLPYESDQPPGPALYEAVSGNAGVHRFSFQSSVFGHKAQGSQLAAITDFDADLQDASQPNRDIPAQTKRGRLYDAAFDGVAREVNVVSNHDIVAEFEQVAVG